MSKKLAIKGHPTRGKEVIKLLEMMGGSNPFSINNGKVIGNKETNCYYISEDIAKGYIFWDYIDSEEMDKYNIFTLEEFLEKFPYKVGDIVDRNIDYVSCIIDDMRWNSEKCCVEYHLNYLNGGEYGWHVSDCLIKSENEDVIIGTKIESTGFMQMGKTVSVIFNSENYEDEVELQLGDYEIEVRDGKTYAVKKKSKYPKTYNECCDEIKFKGVFKEVLLSDDERSLYISFIQLIRCRNAYWKIAGEQMGLGKPWEPEYVSLVDNTYFIIQTFNGEIDKSATSHRNVILAFPTEEMRDAFYKNFKDLIEQCKELLWYDNYKS